MLLIAMQIVQSTQVNGQQHCFAFFVLFHAHGIVTRGLVASNDFGRPGAAFGKNREHFFVRSRKIVQSQIKLPKQHFLLDETFKNSLVIRRQIKTAAFVVFVDDFGSKQVGQDFGVVKQRLIGRNQIHSLLACLLQHLHRRFAQICNIGQNQQSISFDFIRKMFDLRVFHDVKRNVCFFEHQLNSPIFLHRCPTRP